MVARNPETGTSTPTYAAKLRAQKLAEIGAGKFVAPRASVTFKELAEEFLGSRVKPRPTALPAPNPGSAIHHAAFGEKLKEKADQCGATVVLFDDGSGAPKPDPNEFLLKHLKP